ncbi:FxLYD domain-containing protein [Halobium salinum]|uniref:FxLYD domain-containing protein n=1 Tax=Halobium salinum TaxID=1364940 RepID=A0ABD5PE54_9EURY|nr:FxLYD domain-containing protein [Halobium salinum]
MSSAPLAASVYERRHRVAVERRAVLAAAAALLLLGVASRVGTGPAERSEPPVEVVAASFYVGRGLAGVRGSLRNVSGESLPTVTATVRFLDVAGERLAEGTDRVERLAPGVLWQFEVPCLDTRDGTVDAGAIADYDLVVRVGG